MLGMSPGAVTGLVGFSVSFLLFLTVRHRVALARRNCAAWAARVSVLIYSWPVFAILAISELLRH